MNEGVLDASALLAVLHHEPGGDVVLAIMAGRARIGAANLAEVVTVLAEGGMDESAIQAALASVDFDVVDFDRDLALATGLPRPLTRHAGLSLGDRACLALARRLGSPAITADRNWQRVQVGVDVQVIR